MNTDYERVRELFDYEATTGHLVWKTWGNPWLKINTGTEC